MFLYVRYRKFALVFTSYSPDMVKFWLQREWFLIQIQFQTNTVVFARYCIPGQAWPAWSDDLVPQGVSGRRPPTLSWNPLQSWALRPFPSRYRQQTNSDRCCKEKWINYIHKDGFIVTKYCKITGRHPIVLLHNRNYEPYTKNIRSSSSVSPCAEK